MPECPPYLQGNSLPAVMAGAVSSAIPAASGDPTPMCVEAEQHLEQLATAQHAVDAWHRAANPAWHVFKAVTTANGVAVQCLACPMQKNGQTSSSSSARSAAPSQRARWMSAASWPRIYAHLHTSVTGTRVLDSKGVGC
jgi:hypothetical protein